MPLSVDELLALAGQKIENIKENSSDVFQYIFHNNIEKGDTKVDSDIVYQHFKSTTNSSKKKRAFMKVFRKYFTQGRSNRVRYYLLNPSQLGLPEDYSIYKQQFVKQEDRKRKKVPSVKSKIK